MDIVKNVPPELDIMSPDDQAELDEAGILESQVALCEEQYTREERLSVTCAAYNVNQKRPPDNKELRQWLRLDSERPPDVIAVGLQELDMSAGAMLREKTAAADAWRDALARATQDQWDHIGSRQLVGLYLAVYVRRGIAVRHCDMAVVRCGAMGARMANKGGIGLRLQLHRTTFAFVTAHLAAHLNEWQKRNRDFERIHATMNFPGIQGGQALAMLRDQERVFFFGDLNYRIELPYEECCSLIEKGEWAKLHERDQLRQQLGRADSPYARLRFRDALPEFAPTYKYDSQSVRYDTSEKRRVPAWTDRVLWWAPPYAANGTPSAPDPVQLRDFWREEVMTSDHRPVAACFDAAVKVEIPEERERVKQTIREKMEQVGVDRFALPNIALDRSQLDFGHVTFGTCSKEEVRLTNKGHIVVLVNVHSFSGMRDAPQQRRGASRWLSVSTLQLRVDPGATEKLEVLCCVDKEAVSGLHEEGPFRAPEGHSDPPMLGNWLALTAGQQRFFVECTAVVAPSCFGARLDHLSVCGTVPAAQAYLLPIERQPRPPNRPSVPKEIWFMVDYISRHGVGTSDLFEDDISPEAFASIRQHLDERCEPFPDGSVEVRHVAAALLRFLYDLQQPVVPKEFHERCLQKMSRQQAKDLMLELPAVNFNVFHYLLAFLTFLLRNKAQNELTPEALAQAFGVALLQRPTQRTACDEAAERDRVGATLFMMALL
eukprot:TRINITY_DN4851_c0_g1_i1.p1 TRINITY_DN4851_c0_g1~~TRINITY_DN4851_c0_g1_i1.p1  ORF type:complete len:745 (+),score=219.25 TRINITY_DN4851_c0_g1_i1:89-2236(+)